MEEVVEKVTREVEKGENCGDVMKIWVVREMGTM